MYSDEPTTPLMDGATMASGARVDPHPAPSDGMGSRNSSGASVQIQRSTSSLEMRAETAPALHVDSNAQLSHAVKARRRQLRMKLNSIDSEEGDENVRQEIDKRVEQDARDAYESLRSQGKLVAATFATQSLGLSLVLSRFAPTPHQLKRKELTPQKTLRRTLSNGDLNKDEDDEGRRLVIVEDTFSDRGGGVARALLRPMDELVGVSTSPFADEAPPVEDVDLEVDLTPSAFDALLVKIRDAPRPLTLVFARGRCLAAVRRRPRPLSPQKPHLGPTRRRGHGATPPRPRSPSKKRRAPPPRTWRRFCADASSCLQTVSEALVRGVLACLDAPMRRLRRRRKMTPTNHRAAPRGHRRISSEPLPTHFFAEETTNLV